MIAGTVGSVHSGEKSSKVADEIRQSRLNMLRKELIGPEVDNITDAIEKRIQTKLEQIEEKFIEKVS